MGSTPPPPPKPTVSIVKLAKAEEAVDRVIERIDQALPKIIQQAEESRVAGRPPSDRFSIREIERTRQAFEQMSEDSLLTRSGEDIQLDDEPRREPTPPDSPGKLNGKLNGKPHVKPKLLFKPRHK